MASMTGSGLLQEVETSSQPMRCQELLLGASKIVLYSSVPTTESCAVSSCRKQKSTDPLETASSCLGPQRRPALGKSSLSETERRKVGTKPGHRWTTGSSLIWSLTYLCNFSIMWAEKHLIVLANLRPVYLHMAKVKFTELIKSALNKLLCPHWVEKI